MPAPRLLVLLLLSCCPALATAQQPAAADTAQLEAELDRVTIHITAPAYR